MGNNGEEVMCEEADRKLRQNHRVRSILTGYMIGSFESAIVKNMTDEILNSLEE